MNANRVARAAAILVLLLAALSGPALADDDAARQNAQAAIAQAETAMRMAEHVAAPLLAPELYNEAVARLRAAREDLDAKKRGDRQEAHLSAIEAEHAAQAAEARARWVASNREVVALRSEITGFGAKVETVALVDPGLLTLGRGSNSRERVAFAERVVDAARVAGAHLVEPDDIRIAESNLATARKVVKNQKNSDTADHLAYVAEMLARRAEYTARRGDVDRYLPGLRLERTRVAQSASEAAARRELQAREEAQRQAADLRQRLEAEAASRRMQQEELDRLRQQVIDNERRIIAQMSGDREARIAAERRLDELMRDYESAFTTPRSPDEIAALQRQIEDQRLALRAVQERELASERAASAEVERLRTQLDRERSAGRADVAQLESDLRLRNEEVERARREREQAQTRRAELERAFEQRVAELDRSRREAEAQTAQLQQQVAAERARAEAAESALKQRTAEQSRLAAMERELAAIAQTRNEERGIIVTLPGIFFDTGKSVLTSGAKNVLSRIAEQLKANPSASVIVEGHTDSVGSDETNRRLSTARAEAVRSYLMTQGVAASRLTIVGHGESAPIATNNTQAGRQQNRRVELVFTTPEMTAGR